MKPNAIEVNYDADTLGGGSPDRFIENFSDLAPTRVQDSYRGAGAGGDGGDFSVFNNLDLLSAAAVYIGYKLLDVIVSKSIEDIYDTAKKSLKETSDANKNYTNVQLELTYSLDDVKLIVAVHPVAGNGMGSIMRNNVETVLSLGKLPIGTNVIRIPMKFDPRRNRWEHYLDVDNPFDTRYWGIGTGRAIQYGGTSKVFDSELFEMVS